jgi:hypothetical protein
LLATVANAHQPYVLLLSASHSKLAVFGEYKWNTIKHYHSPCKQCVTRKNSSRRRKSIKEPLLFSQTKHISFPKKKQQIKNATASVQQEGEKKLK